MCALLCLWLIQITDAQASEADASQRDLAAQQSIKMLAEQSKTEPRVRFADGIPVSVSLQLPQGALKGDRIVDQALSYLEAYATLYSLPQPREQLYLKRLVQKAQSTQVHFGQRIKDVPVAGAEIALRFFNGELRATAGRWLPDLPDIASPGLGPAQALRLARAATPIVSTGRPEFARLVMHADSLTGPGSATATLAWQIPLHSATPKSKPGSWQVTIDAHDGSVLQVLDAMHYHSSTSQITSIKDAGGRPLSDFTSELDICTVVLLPELGPGTSHVADYARFLSQSNYDYFHDRHGIHHFTNSGALSVTLNITPVNGAFYPACNSLFFNNSLVIDDVFAHEYMHGVINNSSDLVYRAESGALNESYADLFGELLDDNDAWLVGDDFISGPIRSMSNPPLFTTPHGTRLPEHYDDYINTDEDSGGVHWNSSIPNKAAWLMGQGLWGRALGREKLGYLSYEVATTLTSNARFLDARERSVEVARQFSESGEHGFEGIDVCTVMEAWATVGLGDTCADDGIDRDNDFVPDRFDNCPDTANTWQADLDNDGNDPVSSTTGGDACDEDIDGDGVTEISDQDNCPRQPNPGQEDTDGDGRGDGCDDSDYDLVYDAEDNCPAIRNTRQADFDGDGIGDACDADIDGDTIVEYPRNAGEVMASWSHCTGGNAADCYDNCVVPGDLSRSANRDQADDDNDALGNLCDTCPGLASSDAADWDGDGYGNACDADDDNDGICDAETGAGADICAGVDNCPYASNSGQFDLDGDGDGAACDVDEPLIVDGSAKLPLRELIRLKGPARWVRLPFDPCAAGGCPDHMPHDAQALITIHSPLTSVIRVVSTTGNVLGQGALPTGETRLKFPVAASSRSVITAGDAPFHDSGFVLEFWFDPNAGHSLDKDSLVVSAGLETNR